MPGDLPPQVPADFAIEGLLSIIPDAEINGLSDDQLRDLCSRLSAELSEIYATQHTLLAEKARINKQLAQVNAELSAVQSNFDSAVQAITARQPF